MEEKKLVGVITHYFTGISVAIVRLEADIKVGNMISIEGATTNLTQKVVSMQIDGKNISEAKKGQSVGLKVDDRVRQGDKVFFAAE